MLKHVETLFHLIHWDHPEAMRRFFATYNNTRTLLTTTSPSEYPLKPDAQASGFKESWNARTQRDSFEEPQSWYEAHACNADFEDEKSFPEESKNINVPCLYVSGTEDAVCRTDLMEMELVKELVPNVVQHVVESNHWITYEKPTQVGGILAG